MHLEILFIIEQEIIVRSWDILNLSLNRFDRFGLHLRTAEYTADTFLFLVSSCENNQEIALFKYFFTYFFENTLIGVFFLN